MIQMDTTICIKVGTMAQIAIIVAAEDSLTDPAGALHHP
jgi:hypothetical protein